MDGLDGSYYDDFNDCLDMDSDSAEEKHEDLYSVSLY